MGQLEFLKLIIRILDQAGFRYMIVGSYASGYWGELPGVWLCFRATS